MVGTTETRFKITARGNRQGMDTSGGGARRVTACRVCGQDNWQNVMSLGPMPLANAYLDATAARQPEPRYPLDVISCRGCRLMSLTQIVDPATLYRDYAYVTPDSATMTQHLRYVASLCRQAFSLRPGDLVVEVGSNTGAQLAEFRQAGLRTLGVDPACNLAAIATANGIETLSEFFTLELARQVAGQHGRARLILARHVFAHIDDVAAAATAAAALLSKDGVLAIEVPYLVDLLEKAAFDTIYHEHLSYFSAGTLASLLERHHLRVIDVQRLPIHGGSILIFAAPAVSERVARPSVGELLGLERSAGLDDDATYTCFARKAKGIRDDLRSLIRGLAAEGKTVAGYGAPAKGNTLLNYCGLGPGEIAFCSDTTSFKQGKLLPGTHIPVLSPDEAKDRKPDCYLLLAWNYAQEIVARESSFLAGGGEFIVPIPRPSVIPAASPVPA